MGNLLFFSSTTSIEQISAVIPVYFLNSTIYFPRITQGGICCIFLNVHIFFPTQIQKPLICHIRMAAFKSSSLTTTTESRRMLGYRAKEVLKKNTNNKKKPNERMIN